jgi:hypothetical protein
VILEGQLDLENQGYLVALWDPGYPEAQWGQVNLENLEVRLDPENPEVQWLQ